MPSTFFVAVDNGLGLHYSLKDAEFWIKKYYKKDLMLDYTELLLITMKTLKMSTIFLKKYQN